MEVLERGLVLAKQMLSQLSYSPTVRDLFILTHSRRPRYSIRGFPATRS